MYNNRDQHEKINDESKQKREESGRLSNLIQENKSVNQTQHCKSTKQKFCRTYGRICHRIK